MWQRRGTPSSDPPVPGAEAADAAALVAAGDRLRDAGDPSAAADAYARALAAAPWLTGIRVQHGNMLKDCGRLPEAEAAYTQAATESPDDPDILLQLGHALKMMGRRPAALRAYRQAAALDPFSAAALNELRAAGDAAALDQAFAAQLRAGGAEALLGLSAEIAELRDRLDRLAEALPDLRAAVAYPIARYTQFRRLFDVPPPPDTPMPVSFLVIVAADGVAPAVLYAQLAALRAQHHADWRAIFVGGDAGCRAAVERAAAAEPRLAWEAVAAGETLAAAECRLAATVAADWLLLPGAGAVLHPHALGWFAAASALGEAVAYVCDGEAGAAAEIYQRRFDPVLRQVVDYDSLLEANTGGETVAIRRDVFLGQAGRLCRRSPAAARHSLLLETSRRQRVGHIPLPLAWSERAAAEDATADAHAAVAHHLGENGLIDRIAVAADQGPALRVRWRPQQPAAAITVIVPTRDNADDVRVFTNSLLANAAQRDRLALIVVDNGSAAPAQHALAQIESPGLRVLRIDEPFNWSRLNNLAAGYSEAPLLVFANDDMRMLTAGWDDILRGLLERPQIGAVGARLLYPDDTLQHAGILFGWQGATIHDGVDHGTAETGPNWRWQVSRAVSAVTGAFLATRRRDFDALGGFDEAELPIAFSDIDYALKLRATGLRVLWTPGITLYHHESKTRGVDYADPARQARYVAEQRVVERRWGAALAADPGVNPLWHDAGAPFRLIAPVSAARLAAHLGRCAAADPWRVTRAATGV